MLSLVEISQAISSYRSGRISIDAFEDWFRDNSRGMFGEDPSVLAVCLSIESAFSQLRFGDVDEHGFCGELAAAIRPFEFGRKVVLGKPARRALYSGSFSYPVAVRRVATL